MVRGRLIPTTFFHDPDVMTLSSGDVRLILVGLVLRADDYGRGVAQPDIVGRDLAYPAATIEVAFAELEQVELVQRYQAGRHSYYVICRWNDWQKLHKPTPSKYPAPPARHDRDAVNNPGTAGTPRDFPRSSGISPGNPGKSGESSPESESESESESKGNRVEVEEGEARAQPPLNVVPFPSTTRDDDASTRLKKTELSETLRGLTEQLAAILQVPLSEGLARIVADYHRSPGISLVGEADAAREWVDDPSRNRKGQVMSLAFFRRWLQREVETASRRPAYASQATTGYSGRTGTTGSGPPPGGDQQTLDPYATFVRRREAEVKQLLKEGGPLHEASS